MGIILARSQIVRTKLSTVIECFEEKKKYENIPRLKKFSEEYDQRLRNFKPTKKPRDIWPCTSVYQEDDEAKKERKTAGGNVLD